MDEKIIKALRILNDRIEESTYYESIRELSPDTRLSLKQVQDYRWEEIEKIIRE